MIYLLTSKQQASEILDDLNFDPLLWLGINEPNMTMGELFKLAKPFEDTDRSKEDRFIRYCDDDVCFEISFKYLKGGISEALDKVEPDEMVYLFVKRSSKADKFYLIDVAGEF